MLFISPSKDKPKKPIPKGSDVKAATVSPDGTRHGAGSGSESGAQQDASHTHIPDSSLDVKYTGNDLAECHGAAICEEQRGESACIFSVCCILAHCPYSHLYVCVFVCLYVYVCTYNDATIPLPFCIHTRHHCCMRLSLCLSVSLSPTPSLSSSRSLSRS